MLFEPFGVRLSQAGARAGTSASGVRRDKAALSSGCKPHPANSLQPEAIGAVMEMLWGERRGDCIRRSLSRTQ